MAIPISNVNSTSDTFLDWLDKTNQVLDNLSTKVITTEANTTGGVTSGNAYVSGTLSANIVAAMGGVRGGNVQFSNTLYVTSNVAVTNSSANLLAVTANSSTTRVSSNAYGLVFNVESIDINSVGYTLTANAVYDGQSFTISTNTASIGSNTLSVSANSTVNNKTTTVNTETFTVRGGTASFVSNVTVTGLANIQGNATFSSDVVTFDSTINVDSGTLYVDKATNRVGILTASPDSALTVNGTANVTAAVKVGANVQLNTSSVSVGNSSVNTVVLSTGITTANISVSDTATLNTVTANGVATFRANVVANGQLTVSNVVSFGNTTITGFANISSTLAAGNTTVTGFVNVTSNAAVAGATSLGGNTSIAGELSVTNTATFGNTTITGSANISTTVAIAGNVAVNTNALVVNASGKRVAINTSNTSNTTLQLRVGGNTLVEDTLYVSESIYTDFISANTFEVSGNITFSGTSDGSFIPSLDDTFSIGNTSNKWIIRGSTGSFSKDLSVSGNASIGGFTSSSKNITVGSAGSVQITANGTSVDVANNIIRAPAHGLANGDMVAYSIGASNTGILGLSLSEQYYVVGANSSAFQLSAIPGGSAVSLQTTGAGTGHFFNRHELLLKTHFISVGNSTVNTVISSNGVDTDGYINVATTANVGGVANFRANVVANGQLTVSNAISVGNTVVTGYINVSSSANIAGALVVGNTAALGNTTVTGFVNVSSWANVGSLTVAGASTLKGNVVANGQLTVSNTATVGNTTVSGFINVSSTASVVGPLSVTNTAAFGNTTITGSASISTTLGAGNTTITGFANISSTLAAGNTTVTGNLSVSETVSTKNLLVSGNLTVDGTVTYINTTELDIGDNIIVLNADVANTTAPSQDAGFTVNRGSSANVSFLWSETNDVWTIGNTSVTGTANISSSLAVGSNVVANTSVLKIGNSSVYSTTDASGFYATTSANVGANVVANTSSIRVGNSSVNAIAISTGITVSNATITTAAGLSGFSTGNSTVNTTATQTSIATGNSTVNTTITSTGLSVGNSTVNASLTSSVMTIANVVATNLSGNGTSVTSLNASAIATGTVHVARLGSGTANSTTYLTGNNTWVTIDTTVNLGKFANATVVVVENSKGTNAIITSANTSAAGVMSAADKTKLDGIAANAQTGTVTSLATSNGITGGTITTTGTIGLTGQALSLHNVATDGIFVRANSTSVVARSIAGGTGVTVTNGSGAGGNPSIAIGQEVATTSSVRFGSLGVGVAAGDSGEIRATGDITAYYSDERLKVFLGSIPNALDKVTSLGGYYFVENETAKKLGYTNDKQQVGLNAQEVQKVLPEVVKPAPIDNKYLTVQYEKLVPLLVEAIKELNAKVEELTKKLQ